MPTPPTIASSPTRLAARAAIGAAALLAACTATSTPRSSPRDEHEDSEYAVRYFALTGSPRVAEPGEKELRSKVRHDRATTELALEAEYGAAERLQFDVEVPYAVNHSAPDDGIPAIEVGTKVALRDDPRRFAMSMALTVGVPIENEHTDTKFETLFAQRLDDVQVHAVVGIQWDVEDTAYPWSMAAALTSLHDELRPTLEVFGEGNLATIAPGVVWSLDHGMEAALAVPMRLHGDAESIGIALSFLIEW